MELFFVINLNDELDWEYTSIQLTSITQINIKETINLSKYRVIHFRGVFSNGASSSIFIDTNYIIAYHKAFVIVINNGYYDSNYVGTMNVQVEPTGITVLRIINGSAGSSNPRLEIYGLN